MSVSPAGAGNLAVEEQPAQASLDDGKSTAGARDGNNADSDVVVAEVLTGVPLSSVDLDLDIENKELPDDADGQLEEEKGEVEPEPTLAELIARAANDDAAMDLCIAANATTQPACEQVVQEGASAGDGRGVVHRREHLPGMDMGTRPGVEWSLGRRALRQLLTMKSIRMSSNQLILAAMSMLGLSSLNSPSSTVPSQQRQI